jgi:hypothetical protein
VDWKVFIGLISIIIIIETLSGFLIFSRKKNRKKEEIEKEKQENKLLCRFVLDGMGRKIGESVAVNEDVIIIKDGGKYLGVPLKHIEESEKTLVVKGLVDKLKAEEMGEKWKANSFKELDQSEACNDGF